MAAVDTFKKKGILLDVSLFEQILYNIFLNACKFNKENGSIKMNVQVFNAVEINQNQQVPRIENKLAIQT